MSKYTDEDILAMKKVTCEIAGDYLGINPMAVRIGLRNERLPIGFAVQSNSRYSSNWAYYIIAERLVAYKHGRIKEVQIEGIERNLEQIAREFADLKRDLVQLLRKELI
ncbi:MAG: hypothetical protein IJL53_10800 [Firmicutes bacterium]|nr:hypothetical protein [Bacillota bacterium]